MSSYNNIQSRLSYEETKLETLLVQTKVARATIKTLKTQLAKAEKEAVKKSGKDSEGLPLTEVRDEGETEALVFTDGRTSKIETVRKEA